LNAGGEKPLFTRRTALGKKTVPIEEKKKGENGGGTCAIKKGKMRPALAKPEIPPRAYGRTGPKNGENIPKDLLPNGKRRDQNRAPLADRLGGEKSEQGRPLSSKKKAEEKTRHGRTGKASCAIGGVDGGHDWGFRKKPLNEPKRKWPWERARATSSQRRGIQLENPGGKNDLVFITEARGKKMRRGEGTMFGGLHSKKTGGGKRLNLERLSKGKGERKTTLLTPNSTSSGGRRGGKVGKESNLRGNLGPFKEKICEQCQKGGVDEWERGEKWPPQGKGKPNVGSKAA